MHMKHTNQKVCFGSFKASCSYSKLIQTKPNGNNMLPCTVSGNMEGVQTHRLKIIQSTQTDCRHKMGNKHDFTYYSVRFDSLDQVQ